MALSLTQLSPNTATVGVPYSGSIVASGGTPAYTYSDNYPGHGYFSLPAWATLNTATGAVTGTPTDTSAPFYSLNFGVYDSAGEAISNNSKLTVAGVPQNYEYVNRSSAVFAGSSATAYMGRFNGVDSQQLDSWAGDTVFVWALYGRADTFAVSDNQGNTYTSLGSFSSSLTGEPAVAELFMATVGSDGFLIVTTTVTGPGMAEPPGILIVEYWGITSILAVGEADNTAFTSPAEIAMGSLAVGSGWTFAWPGGNAPINTSNVVCVFAVAPAPLQSAIFFTFRYETWITNVFPYPTLNGVAYSSWASRAALPWLSSYYSAIGEPAPPTFFVYCDSPPGGMVGTAYSHTFPASGGVPPYTFSISSGSLPPGLGIDGATGVVSGTPTMAGTYPFTVQVEDANSTIATVACSIVVSGPLTINCGSPPSGAVGTPYTYTITASGGTGPYTFTVSSGSLPSGLSLNSSTGVISGTPTMAGSFPFVIQVEDAVSATATCSISITITSSLMVTCGSPPDGTVGIPYTTTIPATGGTPPYTFSIVSGSLPTGTSIDSGTGVISGTPTVAGVYPFRVQVEDADSAIAQVNCSITIVTSTLAIACGNPPAGIVGQPYNYPLAGYLIPVSGGVPPYTFSWTGGPPGLFLNVLLGLIFGVPTQPGIFPYTITVTDSDGVSRSVTCRIAVSLPIVILALNYRELDTAAAIAASPPIRTSYTGRLIATDHTRKWTRWHVPAVGAALMYRQAGLIQPVFFGANGNFYILNAAQLHDDDYGQIFPYYFTYGFVTHDAEMALTSQDATGERMPLGSGRKLLAYLKAFIAGTGVMTITPYTDSLIVQAGPPPNPWPLVGVRSLVATPSYDLEWGGGMVQGDRIFLKYASSPTPGDPPTVDNGFSLQRMTAFLKRAQRLPIRGQN